MSSPAVVLPGDALPLSLPSTSSAAAPIALGPGVLHVVDKRTAGTGARGETVVAVRAGVLGYLAGKGVKREQQQEGGVEMQGAGAEKEKEKEKGKARAGERWWIEGNGKRYLPALGESVIGIISARHAEGYRVDIASSSHASLDALAFEGATKRNKPNLKVGTLVYARVSLAHKDMETELECVNPNTGKGEGFGELKEGFLLEGLSLGLCRNLLRPTSPILDRLSALLDFPFELATGTNGRVWVKAAEARETIVLARCLARADAEGLAGLDKGWVEGLGV